MMKALIAALALVLLGCSQSEDYIRDRDDYYVAGFPSGNAHLLQITEDVPSHLVDKIEQAVDRINHAVGFTALYTRHVGSAKSLTRTPGALYISYGGDTLESPDLWAVCTCKLYNCQIILTTESDAAVVVHELLHAFGFDHVEDESDVLFPFLPNGEEIKSYVVRELKARKMHARVWD